MKMKCDECEEIFDSYDADSYQECVGEFHGTPAYETFLKCPFCGSTEIDEYEESEDEDEE